MKFLHSAIAPSLLALLFPLVATADIQFSDVTTSAGLVHAVMGEGVGIFDFDEDGWEDIFIADFGGRNLLYRNLGNMTFEEVGAAAGIDSTGRTRLAVAADFDNDGHTDLFLGCHEDASRLFRNNGDGTFSDVTGQSGINSTSNSRGGGWFDYDRDGWLDAYVGNLTTANMLCRNNGDNTFTEIADSVNAQGPLPYHLVMGVAYFDYDRDGDDDIFMAQDGGLGNVLLARESSGMFSDVSQGAGINPAGQGMGVAIGDYNRDRFFDVNITNLDEHTLFRNNGDGTFENVTTAAGVGGSSGNMGWGTFFFDADNDGWLDIYNNHQTGFGNIPNTFFHNLGDGTFEDLSSVSGLQCWNDGIGSAYADLDNDGDLDMVLSGYPAPAGNLKLFRNDSDEPHNWVQLTLRSAGTNLQALGSIVELYTSAGVQTSMVAGGSGYVSQNTLRQHFGLGTGSTIDSVVVYWPNGSRERFDNLSVNTHQEILQGTGTTGIREPDRGGPSAFKLQQNYPNPFNPSTRITYSVPDRSDIKLRVFDMLGRELATLVDQVEEQGTYHIVFDARGLSGGVYFCRLEAANFAQTIRMLLVK